MKVYVRHGEDELMFPSFKDFQAMYKMSFVSPDDLVRRENSERWVRAGDLPELRYMLANHKTERLVSNLLWLMVGAFAFSIIIRLFFFSAHH